MRAKRAAKDKKAALAQGEERVDIEKKLQSVGIEPTLLRTRALSVRLNRSAKTASIGLDDVVIFLGQLEQDDYKHARTSFAFAQDS